jgi:hypothetical protein
LDAKKRRDVDKPCGKGFSDADKGLTTSRRLDATNIVLPQEKSSWERLSGRGGIFLPATREVERAIRNFSEASGSVFFPEASESPSPFFEPPLNRYTLFTGWGLKAGVRGRRKGGGAQIPDLSGSLDEKSFIQPMFNRLYI